MMAYIFVSYSIIVIVIIADIANPIIVPVTLPTVGHLRAVVL